MFCGNFFDIAKLLFNTLSESGLILAQLVRIEILVIEIGRVGAWRFLIQDIFRVDASDPGMEKDFF
jgi:hypothetical protein